MNFLILLAGLFMILKAPSPSVHIYSNSKDKLISYEEFILEISSSPGVIVMGEQHYTSVIQNAEARLIQDVVHASHATENFTVGWEFLERKNYGTSFSPSELISSSFPKYKEETLKYLPVLKVTKKLGGRLIGLNASSVHKGKIVQKGEESAVFKTSSLYLDKSKGAYYERFRDVMGNHVKKAKLWHYYLAQIYTDAYMAESLKTFGHGPFQFMIVGSFHSDVYQGTVPYLKKRFSGTVKTVRFVDDRDDFEKVKKWADYIYYIGPLGI